MAQLAAAIMLLALAWLNEHTGDVVDSIFHVCAAPSNLVKLYGESCQPGSYSVPSFGDPKQRTYRVA